MIAVISLKSWLGHTSCSHTHFLFTIPDRAQVFLQVYWCVTCIFNYVATYSTHILVWRVVQRMHTACNWRLRTFCRCMHGLSNGSTRSFSWTTLRDSCVLCLTMWVVERENKEIWNQYFSGFIVHHWIICLHVDHEITYAHLTSRFHDWFLPALQTILIHCLAPQKCSSAIITCKFICICLACACSSFIPLFILKLDSPPHL